MTLAFGAAYQGMQMGTTFGFAAVDPYGAKEAAGLEMCMGMQTGMTLSFGAAYSE